MKKIIKFLSSVLLKDYLGLKKIELFRIEIEEYYFCYLTQDYIQIKIPFSEIEKSFGITKKELIPFLKKILSKTFTKKIAEGNLEELKYISFLKTDTESVKIQTETYEKVITYEKFKQLLYTKKEF